MLDLGRRQFITLLGGAAAAARGGRAAGRAVADYRHFGESTPSGQREWVAIFVRRLRERVILGG